MPAEKKLVSPWRVQVHDADTPLPIFLWFFTAFACQKYKTAIYFR
jgi:hypothetical protein